MKLTLDEGLSALLRAFEDGVRKLVHREAPAPGETTEVIQQLSREATHWLKERDIERIRSGILLEALEFYAEFWRYDEHSGMERLIHEDHGTVARDAIAVYKGMKP